MPQRVGNVELCTGLKGVGGPDDQQLGLKLTRWTIGERRHRGRFINGAHVTVANFVVRAGREPRLLCLVRKAAPVARISHSVTSWSTKAGRERI